MLEEKAFIALVFRISCSPSVVGSLTLMGRYLLHVCAIGILYLERIAPIYISFYPKMKKIPKNKNGDRLLSFRLKKIQKCPVKS